MQLICIISWQFYNYPSISSRCSYIILNAASIDDLASNGMVSLFKVIIRNAGVMHFIGFLNCNNNKNAFASKSTRSIFGHQNSVSNGKSD